jgi:hypothetical protein
MSAGLSYLRLVATRTRSPLAPAAAVFFALIGTFAGSRNEVGSTWALTALLAGGLAAWLVAAVLCAEPEAQADTTTTALGGRAARGHLEVLLIGSLAAALTAAFIAYPLILQDVFGRNVFDRSPTEWDIAAAFVGLAGCSILGGSIGALFAPPRVRRRATAFAGISATLIVLVAASPPRSFAAGPVGVARAVETAHGQAVGGSTLLAGGTCVLLAIVLLALSRAWTRRVT